MNALSDISRLIHWGNEMGFDPHVVRQWAQCLHIWIPAWTLIIRPQHFSQVTEGTRIEDQQAKRDRVCCICKISESLWDEMRKKCYE